MRTFLIFSQERSGQHAIINWICKQSKVKTFHYNAPQFPAFTNGSYNGRIELFNLGKKVGVRRHVKNYNPPKDNAELRVYNFEEVKPKKIESKLIVGDVKNIIIIRDFYNWLASSIKRVPKERASKKFEEQLKRIPIWIKSCEIILKNNKEYYTIIYNNWFSDREYRKKISNDLKLNETDYGLNDVSKVFGEGSSFDKDKFNGKANQMKVLNRYEQYVNDKKYIDLINKFPEANILNKKIFGFDINDITK